MPPTPSYFHCQLFEIPEIENPIHLVQFEILLDPNSAKRVQSINIFECDDDYTPRDPNNLVNQACFGPGFPDEVNRFCRSKFLIAWVKSVDNVSERAFTMRLLNYKIEII